MELHQNRLYSFRLEERGAVLVFDWREATANMSGEEFMDALSNFAGFAIEHHTPAALVDVRRFRHNVAETIGAWRDAAVTPRYNAAGVRRFAYLVPQGRLPSDPSPAPQGQEKFETRYFDSEQKARAWLLGG